MSNPTFPIVQPPGAIVVSEGMTVRDYFAGQALMGLLASRSPTTPTFNPVDDAAYITAVVDAMMAARAAGAEPEAE